VTIEEENLQLRKRLQAAQTLIHQQRARERHVRHTRLAVVAGNFVDQIDPKRETEKANAFLASAETKFQELVEALRFYGAPANYKNALGATSLNSPVVADGGARARRILVEFV